MCAVVSQTRPSTFPSSLELKVPTKPWLVNEAFCPCPPMSQVNSSDSSSTVFSSATSSIFSAPSIRSNATSFASESTDAAGARILSMDGGGIKAASITIILDAVINLLVQNGYPADTKPSDVWNVFCGSSAGGFLAYLFSKKFTPLQALDAWNRFSRRIFKVSSAKRTYSLFVKGSRFGHEKLETVLKEMILEITGNENSVLSNEDDDCTCIVVTVPAASFNHPSAVLFSSKTIPGKQSSSQVPIWKILRATSAAPTYFPPQEIAGQMLIDGGIGFNNPTELAVSCARRLFPQTGIESILSVGCGETNPKATGGFWKTFKAMGSFVTDTSAVHVRMEDNYGPSGQGIYARLEVDGGMGSIAGLSDWRMLDYVKDTTALWLSGGHGKGAVELLAEQMTLKFNKSRRSSWSASS